MDNIGIDVDVDGLIKDIGKRVNKIRVSLEENRLDAFLAVKLRNVRYLTGKETGRVLITRDHAVLWVKDIYVELYSEFYSDKNYKIEVREYEKDVVKDFVNRLEIKRLGVENIAVIEYRKVSENIKGQLLPCSMVEKLRAVKSEYEIGLLRKAAEIAKKGMEKAYEVVDEGASEVDAVAEIEAEIRRQGSETPPFEGGMLLASGDSSSDIHAFAQNKKISSDSVTVVDLGGRYQGYHSDMTRTIRLGSIGKEQKEIFEFIENLELETIDEVHAGVKASEIHGIVEKKIKKKGYQFYHSTGHGVGLNIHEKPSIGSGSEDTIENNMVFTIEPGIYIPKRFGVRFEDTILLRKNKKENLTR